MLLFPREGIFTENLTETMIEKQCCIIGNMVDTKLQNIYSKYMEYELEVLILDGFTQFITYYGSEFNHAVIKILDRIRKASLKKIHIELVVINLYTIVRSNEKQKREYSELVEICDKITIINTVYSSQNRLELYEYIVKKCSFLLYLGDISFRGNMINKKIVKTFKENYLSMKIINPAIIPEVPRIKNAREKRTEHNFMETLDFLLDGLSAIKQEINIDRPSISKIGLKLQEKLDEEVKKYLLMETESISVLNHDSKPVDKERLEFLRNNLNEAVKNSLNKDGHFINDEVLEWHKKINEEIIKYYQDK